MAKKLSDLIGQFATIPNSFILQSAVLSTEAKWMFVILRYHTNSKTGNAFPSYTKIQEITGFHRKTISKSLKELETAGWLTKQRRFGATTIYALQLPSSSISDTTEQDSSSLNSTVSSSTSATISSSDGVNANQTEEETRSKEQDIKHSSPHTRLMAFHDDHVAGPIPDAEAQGAAVKWLLKTYKPETCESCYSALLRDDWRARVTWLTVKSEIGSWIPKNGNGHVKQSVQVEQLEPRTAEWYIKSYEVGLSVAPNYDVAKDIADIPSGLVREQVDLWWKNQCSSRAKAQSL